MWGWLSEAVSREESWAAHPSLPAARYADGQQDLTSPWQAPSLAALWAAEHEAGPAADSSRSLTASCIPIPQSGAEICVRVVSLSSEREEPG